jgi:chromosomal replication initiation ATPase DnaA
MRPPARQLTLGLPVTAAMGRADFLVAPPNALALSAIEDPAGLPQGRLVLTGPAGSGKTHLAHVWAARTGARWLRQADLAALDAGLLAALAGRAVVIDDAAPLPAQEAAFHLLNHMAATGGQVLLTARGPVRDWGLTLPDLVSRLTAAAHVALGPPDDALLAAVLVKLFNDRQIRVQPALVDYLVARMDRSLAAAGAVVDRLDRAALTLHRQVNRSLAQEILGEGPGA